MVNKRWYTQTMSHAVVKKKSSCIQRRHRTEAPDLATEQEDEYDSIQAGKKEEEAYGALVCSVYVEVTGIGLNF